MSGKSSNTIAVLDGVRAIACFFVICYHIHYLYSLNYNLLSVVGKPVAALLLSGWSGVTLFFVLSGFLLFMPYARAILWQEQWPSTRIFYLRRMLRILPGYYLALSILILLKHPEYLRPDHIKLLGTFLAFIMDAPATHLKINGPFWTLAVEWQYYLILPWLALVIGWFAGRGTTPEQRLRRVIYALIILICWGVGTRYIGRYYFTFHPQDTFLVSRAVMNKFLLITYGTTGKYYEDFALGMLISAIYVYTGSAGPAHAVSKCLNRYSGWLWGGGIVWLLFLSVRAAFPLFKFLGGGLAQFNWLSEISYSLGFGLCILALLYGPRYLKRLLDGPAIRWMGLISYSLYIWHVPVLDFVREKVLPVLPHYAMLAYALYWLCAVLVALPFCYLVYRFVEKPWMQLGHGLRAKEGRPVAPLPAASGDDQHSRSTASGKVSLRPLREVM
ncbi:MAG: acyltransferase [Ktedonobacteraceae bacterium]|nr:acyltransferase [Ktedonobacteraceae bacterium]